MRRDERGRLADELVSVQVRIDDDGLVVPVQVLGHGQPGGLNALHRVSGSKDVGDLQLPERGHGRGNGRGDGQGADAVGQIARRVVARGRTGVAAVPVHELVQGELESRSLDAEHISMVGRGAQSGEPDGLSVRAVLLDGRGGAQERGRAEAVVEDVGEADDARLLLLRLLLPGLLRLALGGGEGDAVDASAAGGRVGSGWRGSGELGGVINIRAD